ncbi:acyl-CoA-dependent ceramide synthase [Aureobasidium sp. EXF-8845]|nr:acyl-CoA-dependent ceramide synthase [Aureobasidium sp. EXF-8845]
MTKPRPRRKSSSLGGEPRGDTGASALATLSMLPQRTSTPTHDKAPRTSKRRKARSLLRRYVRVSLRHTWLNPLILMLLVLALYAVNPSTSNPFYYCIFLAYPLDTPAGQPVQYGKGKADFAFVAFYTIVLSFTREFLMQRMIRPLAIRLGIVRKAKQARFMEQFYTAMYFAIFGPFGLYVMRRSPVWYFNTNAMFEGFPHRTHEAVFKAYYLLQASYWAQQAIVLLLMLEKPRKDFKELVLHHIVTLALIWLSYRFHFTYMGIAVYITMDISDFFLATSKILNYLNSPITGPYFGLFIGVWFYCRHYLNLHILWATLTSFRTVGPYELNWETEQYKCWISQIITFALLFALQAVNVFWFVLVIRIAWRFVRSSVAKDERSEDEEDEEEIVEEQEKDKLKQQLIPSVELNGETLVGATGRENETTAEGLKRRA